MTYFEPVLAAVVFAAASALALSLPMASAQDTANGAATSVEKFSAMDADNNSLVSEAEFVAYAVDHHGASEEDASAKFTQIAGEDGLLSFAEFDAVHTANAKKDTGQGS